MAIVVVTLRFAVSTELSLDDVRASLDRALEAGEQDALLVHFEDAEDNPDEAAAFTSSEVTSLDHADASGRTAEEFMAELFEYELCDECGGDADEHDICMGPFGLWFARCRRPKEGV